ncbi:hypothetical protein XAC3810_730132 [Xanthomonas citri pv. citri]|nr:hypothetical protein XAC3810_730132 [Xanthomonas citri pv. citri]CEJ47680.1 hypothetical protein XAB3213_3960055 [Xanthomonas citri pv. bilvae]CEE75777.1 hypothetical protein XACW160_710108 [Xanthomonas citri pv. citri]CEE80245.1 hypothetical protein XAC2852_790135 [Xanthomonas citri pv. citri]CEE85725.1 hypothetical protein XACLC80_870132 [Xanthomonas citri pv. citri]
MGGREAYQSMFGAVIPFGSNGWDSGVGIGDSQERTPWPLRIPSLQSLTLARPRSGTRQSRRALL